MRDRHPIRPPREQDRLQALIVVPVLLTALCAVLAVAWLGGSA